jgi:hypothetical protein
MNEGKAESQKRKVMKKEDQLRRGNSSTARKREACKRRSLRGREGFII